jgi:uncharacterized protein
MKRLLLALPLIGLAFAGTELELTTPTGILHGTLESPAATDKSCVVLILAGSGPTDRDGNSLGLPGKNDSLKKIAVDLAHRGISSLRCDKRGIGESKAAGPKEENLRFETYIDDVVSWLEFLESKQGFKKVVILGHSEGALVGLVAANKHQVAGYLSLAGTSQRAAVLLREQIASKIPAELLTEANVILQQLDQGFPVKKVSSGLDPLFRKSAQPYLISWFRYTPTEELAKLTCPSLIVQGTTDIQVAAQEGKTLHLARRGSKLLEIEGMNHVLKKVPVDLATQIASYSNPELPLHPELMGPVSEFIHSCTARP